MVPRKPWGLRNFRWLWAGMGVSTLGSHTAAIVCPLLVLALTGSPETVGWVTALRVTLFVPLLLLIVMAQQMGASAAQIGLIFSAGGVGGVLGALVGGRMQRHFSFGQVIIATTLLQAALFPLYAVSPGPLGLGLVYGLIHFLGPVYNVVQFSHRIALIPQGLDGRVNAGFRFVAHLPNPIGAALCGVMIERAGAGVALAFFATVFAVLGMAAAASRTIRHEPSPAQRR